MNRDISEIRSLKLKISNEIHKRKRQNDFSIVNQLIMKSLEVTLERLKKLLSALNTTKYDLVFIGQVGVGKTTAICHLFDLVSNPSLEKKTKDPKIKTSKVQELLPTGLGYTTTCQVIIKQSKKKTFIEIEPYDEESTKNLIQKFAEYAWFRAYPETSDECLSNPIPPELKRAIRNIVDLQLSKISGDEAELLAKKFNEGDFSDFLLKVLKRSALPLRTETILKCNIDDEKAWIRKTLSDISLGKLRTFSIPKMIHVFVSQDVINFKNYPKIKTLIDTRGMDVDGVRYDLDNHIRNQEDLICLLTDRFTVSPSKHVISLLSKYLGDKSKNLAEKVGLLVLFRHGEPENVIGSDGIVDIEEHGIKVRKRQIEEIFSSYNVSVPPDNMIFYNAFKDYTASRAGDLPDYAAIDQEKQRVLTKIGRIISSREASIAQRICRDMNKQFERIKSCHTLCHDEEPLINYAREKFESYRCLNLFPSTNGGLVFIDLCKSFHAVISPSVANKFGDCKSDSIGFYQEVETSFRVFFGKLLEENQKNVLRLTQSIKQKVPNSPILLPVMEAIEGDISSYYNNFVRELAQGLLDFLLYKDMTTQDPYSEPWSRVIVTLGRKGRFRSEVIKRRAHEIAAIEASLRIKAGRLWNGLVIDKVLYALGKSNVKPFSAKYHEKLELQKAKVLVMLESKNEHSSSLRRRLMMIERARERFCFIPTKKQNVT